MVRPSPAPIVDNPALQRFLEEVRRFASDTDSIVEGVNGTIIGSNDVATLTERGVVNQGVAVADAPSSGVAPATSSVQVTQADATAAGVTYSQAQVQSIVDLANDIKAKYNTAQTDIEGLRNDLTQGIADLNAAIVQINELLASQRGAGQIDT